MFVIKKTNDFFRNIVHVFKLLYSIITLSFGLIDGAVLSTIPSQQSGFGFEPCVWVELFCLGFLSQYKDVKLHPEDSPTIYTCHISKHVAQFQLPI